MLGDEVELRLRAVIEAAAEPLAVTDGDLRLREIVAGTLRVGLRIEKDEETRALEGFEHGVGSDRCGRRDQHRERVDSEVAELGQREEKLDAQDREHAPSVVPRSGCLRISSAGTAAVSSGFQIS